MNIEDMIEREHVSKTYFITTDGKRCETMGEAKGWQQHLIRLGIKEWYEDSYKIDAPLAVLAIIQQWECR